MFSLPTCREALHATLGCMASAVCCDIFANPHLDTPQILAYELTAFSLIGEASRFLTWFKVG